MPSHSVESASMQVTELAEKVGFAVADLPQDFAPNGGYPSGCHLWVSNYACMLLWPVGTDTVQDLREASALGEDVVSQILLQEERVPPDGYLILAVPSEPVADALETVRDLELSSRVCRKHVVWPEVEVGVGEAERRWKRLQYVTALGLPTPPTVPTKEAYWPKLDKAGSDLWAEIEKDKPTVVAQRHQRSDE